MKLSGINQNCSFKALVIHPYKKEITENFLKPYENIVNQAAENMDLYICTDDKIVKKGKDYSISIPVINVAIHPKEIKDEKGNTIMGKKFNTVMSTAFSYRPTTQNEKERKFAEVLKKSLSLIG